MMKEAIKTVNLSKRYGKTLVVDNLNLSIKCSEIVGFLGLNGAGKTTTMRMLLGLIKPTSGECYIQGKKVDQYNLEVRNEIGYIIETPYSYPDLTVRENLEIVSTLRGVRNKDAIDWVTEKLKLEQYKDKQVKHLSLGNVARLGIAKAIIHKPKILILDEPTNGLDPFGVIEVRELLKDLADNLGTTVLISSHKLEEIAKIATRIIIIHEGRLIKEVESKELDKRLEKKLLVSGSNNKAIKEVLSNNGYHVNFKSESENNICCVELIDTKSVEYPEEIATLLVNAGYPPKLLTIEKEDLENYFLRMLNDYNGGV
ncbi:ABC transporter ATP-binding protein [Streptococcus intermedius]|uniref:ABC transporter ATP-binding protein n=1 Tax=Streptococcus intermedius TaxID=1338 RepID=UPI00056C3F83|nr:ABC transporter ATP-binding protein [Streptococcus intermedius]